MNVTIPDHINPVGDTSPYYAKLREAQDYVLRRMQVNWRVMLRRRRTLETVGLMDDKTSNLWGAL